MKKNKVKQDLPFSEEVLAEKKAKLLQKFETIKKDGLKEGDLSLLTCSNKQQSIQTTYDPETYSGLSPGDFVFVLDKPGLAYEGQGKIALVVGLGRDKKTLDKKGYIWFLLEGDKGICHYFSCYDLFLKI